MKPQEIINIHIQFHTTCSNHLYK